MNGAKHKTKAKYRQIIDAAERLFFDCGVRGATVEMIAKEAVVSKVTIYNYFGSKDAVLTEAIKRLFETFTKRFEAIVYDSGMGFDEKIDALIAFKTDVIETLPSDVLRAIYNPEHEGMEAMIKWYADNRISVGMRHLIREGRMEDAIDPECSDDAILIFFGLLKQLAGTKAVYDKETLKDVLQLFFYGLGGKP